MEWNDLKNWMIQNNIQFIKKIDKIDWDSIASQIEYFYWYLNNKPDTNKTDFCDFLFNNLIKKYGGSNSKKTIKIFNLLLNLIDLDTLEITNIKLSYFIILIKTNPSIKQILKVKKQIKKFEKYFNIANLFLDARKIFHEDIVIFFNSNYPEKHFNNLIGLVESQEIYKFNKKCININILFEIILNYFYIPKKVNNKDLEDNYITFNNKDDKYVINNLDNLKHNMIFQRHLKKEEFYEVNLKEENKFFNIDYLKNKKYKEKEFINKRILNNKNTKSDVYMDIKIKNQIPHILKLYKNFKLNF